ncbi:response regulator transcription factor [Mesorhizobium sp.]|uniref:LuxR C-terminal-related transcriptional regulator n=1 Tax=Mesorhizobium sp. TaxID=1871066 RepID=UPI000FE9DBC5|nr:response regulator transcription factor [Mesorhizobium sp.]RWI04262.1 MAG: response regulator transcription factor [Mesorhizobium sp.]RWL18020.1 MAG: response regulator transcription factor [Mesorhizobium sp.]TIP40778.1 MAG: response regulator transcription factor [Mesorhizobium sp.]TIP69456.1 MAG: response regulator transcription factor [Mesorhizobium sp.]TIQ19734.1 MAG: response regulator transcription factor [Mesorhizobium sp.]
MTQKKKLNVLIAERNPLVISALCNLIGRDDRFVSVEGIQSGEAFIRAIEETRPAFDVAILGWKMSDMDAGDVLAELRRRQLAAQVVVFSNDHDIGILKQCVRLGAQGFCYQFDDPCILLDTLLAVYNGRICIPYIDVAKINETPLSRLTPRELELLGVLADGWTNLQIGTRTGISENTVKYHLKNLYDKLGVRNRAMAVALYASERNRGPQLRPR